MCTVIMPDDSVQLKRKMPSRAKAEIVFPPKGCPYLRSYATNVAEIGFGSDGMPEFRRLWRGWSATSQRHINAFRAYFNLPPIRKGEWMDMEVAY